MRRVLLICGTLVTFYAMAGKITMQLTEQTQTANEALCRYSNLIYDFMYKTNSKHCPHVKTFSTEDK